MVGIYLANARIEDKGIPFTAGKVADLMRRYVEGCLVLVVSCSCWCSFKAQEGNIGVYKQVDNEKLDSEETALIVSPQSEKSPE